MSRRSTKQRRAARRRARWFRDLAEGRAAGLGGSAEFVVAAWRCSHGLRAVLNPPRRRWFFLDSVPPVA